MIDLFISFEIKAILALEPEEKQGIESVDLAAFTGQDGHGLFWSEGDWVILGKTEQKLVAITNLVDRMARVGGKPVRLGGVGGVAVLPAWQGRGFGRKMM